MGVESNQTTAKKAGPLFSALQEASKSEAFTFFKVSRKAKGEGREVAIMYVLGYTWKRGGG
jgi:hypothetical protein